METKKQHILVTGSSGYLGQHLLSSFLNNDIDSIITAAYGSLSTFDDNATHIPFRKVKLDLTEKSSIDSLLNSIEPVDILIHLAAVSSPAQCEKDAKKCYAINCPLILLQALPDTCDIIFLSTDQVYDGDPKNAPFTETDEAKPVNHYGKSKLEFESTLLQRNEVNSASSKVIILRSSLMLGPKAPIGECRKQSFLQFVQHRLSTGQSTDFFSDEIRCVVHVEDVVKIIQYFISNNGDDNKNISGVYNLGGADRVSRIDLAIATARYLNMDESLCKSVKRFTPEFKGGGVSSPPDISVRLDKLKMVTGIETIGLNDIVKHTFSKD